MRIELEEVEAHLILACKLHYGEVIPAIQKVYEHFYQNEWTEDAQGYMVSKLFEILYTYHIIRNQHDWLEFCGDLVLGRSYWDRDLSPIERGFSAAISKIQNWKVRGRDDGKEYVFPDPIKRFKKFKKKE